MKKILAFLLLFLFIGCKSTNYVPVKEETVITYRDSTIIHQDTIHITIPKEAYNYYTALLDTLTMETNYSIATAYIDTNNKLLKGNMETKDKDIPIMYQWKERVIEHDTTIYQDKPVYVEVPNKKAEREAEMWKWFCMLAVGVALAFGVTIIIKNFIPHL